jgi:ABC-2 type transport system permease protein
MSTLKYLLEKEFRQIFRNPTLLRMIIMLPIMQLIILPLTADYEIKNINISIVDNDNSPFSRALVEKITASGYFKLTDYKHTYKAAFKGFELDAADLILAIPKDFEKDLVREDKQTLFLAANAINSVKASVGSAYLQRVIASYNNNLRTEWQGPMPLMAAPSIEIVTENWFNKQLNYRLFMVPAILAILVTMVGSYLCALNIVKEKEVGTIEQINVSPIKKYQFLLGKLIPFWVIGNVVFSIGLLGVARLVYGIVPVGSTLLLYAFLAVYLVALLGIGLLISTYSSTQQQAMSLAFFMMMIFVLMSGLFTSIDSMPAWAQWIAYMNPVTYFIEVLRMVVLKGSTFADIQRHFAIMAAFALVFNTWAVASYRKRG